MEARVIALSIKSLEQQTKSVSLPRNASVLDLKAKIQTKFDIDGTRQRLIFQGKVLKDDKHLSDYDNLDDGKVVHLVVRPIGAPHNPDNDEPSRNWTSIGSNSSRPSTRLSEGYAVITLDANLTDLPEGHSLMSSIMNLLPSLSPPQTRSTRLSNVLRGGGTDGSHGSLRDYFRQGRRPGLDGLLDVMNARTSPISLPVPSSVEMRLSRTLSYIREIRSLLETPITDCKIKLNIGKYG
ncbi:ubiquitin-related domain-containing protein [Pilaira anomala]|nr:ubiquitin-related domain-containing protein [Pilaira anomala]